MAPTVGSMSPIQAASQELLSKLRVLERQRTHSLAGRRKHGVEHGRSGHANGWLPNATPEIAGGHDDNLDPGEVLHEHHWIGVQILLHHAAVLDGAFLVEHRAEPEGNRAFGLHRHLLRIDRIAAVDGYDETMDFELPAVVDGDFGCTPAIAPIAHELSDAPMYAGRRRCSPGDPLGDGIE